MKPIDKEGFKKKAITVKFSKTELEIMKAKANQAGLKPATYCREISLSGIIMERPRPVDLNEVRLLRQTLLEYKTNFARISNFISTASPSLFMQVRQTILLVQATLKKHPL
jgi:hypothetical protein